MRSRSSSDPLLVRLFELIQKNEDALLKDVQSRFCCDGNPKNLVYKSPEAFEIGRLLEQIRKETRE